METYIVLINLTQQGETHIQDTVKRADTFRATAEKMGAVVKHVYWTIGDCDGIVVFDAPTDKVATALIFHLGAEGNVRTQTMRAYDAEEIKEILSICANTQ